MRTKSLMLQGSFVGYDELTQGNASAGIERMKQMLVKHSQNPQMLGAIYQ